MMRRIVFLIGATCSLPSGKLDGQTIREKDHHAGPVSAVAFMPDSQWLVTGGFDAMVSLDAVSGRTNLAERLHDAKVLSLAVSSDGQQWAAGHIDGKVTLGSPAGAALGPFGSRVWLPPLEEQPSCVYGLVFSPDSRWLLGCTEDGFVRVWEAAARRICQAIHVCPSALYALAISPDGHTIATAGLEGTIYLIDLVSGEILHTLNGHHDAVYALHFSADGKLLASGSGDGTLRLWDAKTGEQRRSLSGHSDALYSVSFDASGQRLMSADTGGLIVLWDAGTWTALYSHRLPGKIMCADLAPDGRHIAAGNACGKCYLIDLPRHVRE